MQTLKCINIIPALLIILSYQLMYILINKFMKYYIYKWK